MKMRNSVWDIVIVFSLGLMMIIAICVLTSCSDDPVRACKMTCDRHCAQLCGPATQDNWGVCDQEGGCECGCEMTIEPV